MVLLPSSSSSASSCLSGKFLCNPARLAISRCCCCFLQMAANRWIRPEVYPLFAAVGVAIGICGFQLVRNICINPEVRVSKENRAAGVLDNFSEGEKYAEHSLRKFVRNRAPEIMPSINSFFTSPDRN